MNKDRHKERAAEIFEAPYEEVTAAQREYAKVVNFVNNYSVSTPLSKILEDLRNKAAPKN